MRLETLSISTLYFTDRRSVNELSTRVSEPTVVTCVPMSTSRQEQAAQSRSKLIAIALDRFVEDGYNATSIASILDEAGMAKGALYHHFPDGKVGLFRAVCDLLDEDFHHGLDEILESGDGPVEQILAGFDVLLQLASRRDFARVMLIEANIVLPGEWEEASEYQLLRDALDRAMKAGEINEAPLDALTSLVFGAGRRSADFVARSKDPKTAAKESQQVFATLIEGLRT